MKSKSMDHSYEDLLLPLSLFSPLDFNSFVYKVIFMKFLINHRFKVNLN